MLMQPFSYATRGAADDPGCGARRAALSRRRRAARAAAPFPAIAQSAPGGGMVTGGEEENGGRSRRPPAAAGGERPGQRERRLRVLIVEDEAVISMELEDMLEGLGCEIVGTAHTAAQAIRLAEQERPDLVTMDVSLPGEGDGVSAATAIFQRHGVRSLFVTAYTDPDTVARAGPANPAGWLRKPISLRSLAAALDALPDPDES